LEIQALRRALAPVMVVAFAAGSAASVALADGDAMGTGGGAVAPTREVVLKRGDRGPAVKRVQGRLRTEVDGIFGRATERSVKRFQRRRGLEVDGVVGPATRRALHLAPFSRASVRRSLRVPLPRALLRIAICESGGNPRAVSPSGRYRGKYQFTRATWRALGGTGDPARASEALQDRLALKLYRKRGTAPWPNCA
jgi:Transglycosylase-like domain/Putative peptidoglycan binding domain